jgi:dephospho-CoA kinase
MDSVTQRMVGLTGGIGAGKSAVAARLAALGAVVIDSDKLARAVVEPGTPGLAQVVARFGPAVLAPDGSLDRPALGRIVFADTAARKDLEAIIHPLVRERSAEIAAAAPPDAVIVNDVPLLVETGLAPLYDTVIVVFASESTRVDRLVRLRGLTEEDARARIAAQASDDQRRAVAGISITNDGSAEALDAAVEAAWQQIRSS